MSRTRRRKPAIPPGPVLHFPPSEYMRRRLSIPADRRCVTPASAGDYRQAAQNAEWQPETEAVKPFLWERPERLLEPPQRNEDASQAFPEDGAQGPAGAPETEAEDIPPMWVYEPDFSSLPERPQYGRRPQFIRVGFDEDDDG